MKILIVQIGRIGDLILTTPLFRYLKEAKPDIEIDLLASRHNFLIGWNHPDINRTVVYRKNPLLFLPRYLSLQQQQYDIWLDVKDHSSTESIWLAKFSKARQKVGYNPPGKNIFDHQITRDVDQAGQHAVQRHLNTLSFLNIDPPRQIPRPVLFDTPEANARLGLFLGKPGIAHYICINISATSTHRYWPQENWQRLIQSLYKQGRPIILIAAPGDRKQAEKLAVFPQVKYYPTTTILDTLSVVKNSGLVITPDTSIVHIAAAYNRPVIGLYGNFPKNFTKFRPLSENYRQVIPRQPGAPVNDIRFDAVLNAYYELTEELR